jgi:APA family basic amino acid/polyamine antiporter
LNQSLRLFDGLAIVVGIMIGSGIFRTPGLVARELGRPWLTFVAWLSWLVIGRWNVESTRA